MKTLLLVVAIFVFMIGCAITPLPPPSVTITPNYRLQANYYGWRSLGWGNYGYYGNGGYGYSGYGFGYVTRWVPGYQRWVCENSPRCYWKWEDNYHDGYDYNRDYRWGHNHQRWVCEDSPRCYWTWEPAHYE